MDDTSVKASKFYILILGYLQDITQSIEYISTTSYNHVNNNHKNLKKTQVKDLKAINGKLQDLFNQIESDFKDKSFTNLSSIINDKQELISYVCH